MSAHSFMRGTFIFALLLVAVSTATATGAPAKAAQAHRKASASAHQARQASSQTKSKTTTASRKAAKRTKLHPAPRATMHKAKYTPERTMMRTPAAANTVSDFEVGYKRGFEAGRAAALRQLDNTSADPNLSGRGSESLQTGAKPLPARESLAAEQPATDRAAHTPPLSGTPEIETPEAPPPAQMASLSMSGMGLPGSLRGSLASLERQNTRTEADGLERIEDEDDLTNRIAHKLLVPLPASAALTVNPGLPAHNRYCRPWTARFVADLARAHQAAFHRPIQVNSAVRTVEYQKRLMRINGNAAAAEGDVVSPHLTGATIDIGKSGLSRKELAWMRQQLLGLQQAGKIDVEEEFEQACFHITVYKSYAPVKAVHKAAEPATNSTQRKTARPATQRHGSQLPADLATGLFPAQGR